MKLSTPVLSGGCGRFAPLLSMSGSCFVCRSSVFASQYGGRKAGDTPAEVWTWNPCSVVNGCMFSGVTRQLSESASPRKTERRRNWGQSVGVWVMSRPSWPGALGSRVDPIPSHPAVSQPDNDDTRRANDDFIQQRSTSVNSCPGHGFLCTGLLSFLVFTVRRKAGNVGCFKLTTFASFLFLSFIW